jgi:hypothetical protein
MAMLDENETYLQLVADNTEAIAPLTDMVAHYAYEIGQRRQRLSDDLAYFESKLQDLGQLDPLDFTGLAKIYCEHASHIRGLLAEIE